jgi:glucose-6-phosphate 1-dehydrogenase
MSAAPHATLGAEPAAEVCVNVIFGATGDLTRRKLLPALYNLADDYARPDETETLRRSERGASAEKDG